jgi:hypothetical protein
MPNVALMFLVFVLCFGQLIQNVTISDAGIVAKALALMLTIVRIVGEALATVATQKGTFICVDALMSFQVPRALKNNFLSDDTEYDSFPPENICHKTDNDSSHSVDVHVERPRLTMSMLAWWQQRAGRDYQQRVVADSIGQTIAKL